MHQNVVMVWMFWLGEDIPLLVIVDFGSKLAISMLWFTKVPIYRSLHYSLAIPVLFDREPQSFSLSKVLSKLVS